MDPNSIVDYLKSKNLDSSLSSRAQLAVDKGFASSTGEYITLASQGKNADINTKLLNSLKSTETTTTVPVAPVVPPQSSNPVIGSTVTSGPITGSQVERGTSLPEPTSLVATTPTKSLSDMVSEVAKTTMSGNQLEIDNLRKQLESLNATEKAAAKGQVDQLTGQVKDIVGSTAAADALKSSNEKFKVEENIKLYSDIQQRIVDAQQALNMGLIYEADRPARMKFITGAESTLQKQGLATIGALQGTAAVIKGNLDLAKAYGDATVNAINSDNDRSFKALTTLLDLANNQLVDLTKNEREIINSRIDSIEKEATRLQNNKDDVLDLMTKYPRAFAAGGVTLLDTKEQALQKMLPTMASDEKIKFETDIANSQRLNKTAIKEDQIAKDKELLLNAKSKGMTYDEAILAFGNTVPITDIAAIYGRKSADTTGEQAITDTYYQQFIDPATGKVKEGYSVTIDPKNGRPVVEKTAASSSGGVWNSIKNWFSGL